MENRATISVEFKLTYTDQQTLSFQDDMFRRGWSSSNSPQTNSSIFFQSGSGKSMLSSMKFMKSFSGNITALEITEQANKEIKLCACSNDILSYSMFLEINVIELQNI